MYANEKASALIASIGFKHFGIRDEMHFKDSHVTTTLKRDDNDEKGRRWKIKIPRVPKKEKAR